MRSVFVVVLLLFVTTFSAGDTPDRRNPRRQVRIYLSCEGNEPAVACKDFAIRLRLGADPTPPLKLFEILGVQGFTVPPKFVSDRDLDVLVSYKGSTVVVSMPRDWTKRVWRVRINASPFAIGAPIPEPSEPTDAKFLAHVVPLAIEPLQMLADLGSPGRHPRATHTGICTVLESPADFHGKWVQVTGVVVHDPEFRALHDPTGCGAVQLVFPDEVDGTGPKVNFTLIRDSLWDEFDAAVSAHEQVPNWRWGGDIILFPKPLYEVTATFVGRLDSAETRNRKGRIVVGDGYGHLNAFRARLVVRRVLVFATKEVP